MADFKITDFSPYPITIKFLHPDMKIGEPLVCNMWQSIQKAFKSSTFVVHATPHDFDGSSIIFKPLDRLELSGKWELSKLQQLMCNWKFINGEKSHLVLREGFNVGGEKLSLPYIDSITIKGSIGFMESGDTALPEMSINSRVIHIETVDHNRVPFVTKIMMDWKYGKGHFDLEVLEGRMKHIDLLILLVRLNAKPWNSRNRDGEYRAYRNDSVEVVDLSRLDVERETDGAIATVVKKHCAFDYYDFKFLFWKATNFWIEENMNAVAKMDTEKKKKDSSSRK